MQKRSFDDINLKIDEMQLGEGSILICWSSTMGVGEYSLFLDEKTGEWTAMSEKMDSDEDKSFGCELFRLLMEKVRIIE